jgi:hypothetical protein
VDELPSEARAFLAALRDAQDPPPGMSERVWRAAGLAGTPPAAAPPPTKPWWQSGSISATKLASLTIALGIGLGSLLVPRSSPPLPRAVPTPPALAEIAPQQPAAPELALAAPAVRLPEAPPRALEKRPKPRAAQHSEDGAAALLAEVASLRAASEALASHQPERALALLQGHRRLFPAAQLNEECEGLFVLARCSLDQAGASAAARAYLRRYPRSVLRDRVERACRFEGSPP